MNAFDIGLTVYLLILAVHIVTAIILIRKFPNSLAIGSVKHPALILLGLLVLNATPVLVFIPASGFATERIAVGVGFYHIMLMFDEIVRMRKVPARAVFLVNHLYWAVLVLGARELEVFSELSKVSTVSEFIFFVISGVA